MRRFPILFLAALLGGAGLAHADTVVSDFTLSYSYYGVAQSVSFSLPSPTLLTGDEVTFNGSNVTSFSIPTEFTSANSTTSSPGFFQWNGGTNAIVLDDSSGHPETTFSFLPVPFLATQVPGTLNAYLTVQPGAHPEGMLDVVLPSGEFFTDPGAILTVTNVTVPTPPAAVTPEPSTFALLGTGLLGLGGVLRRRIRT